jgi:hypothetical protein
MIYNYLIELSAADVSNPIPLINVPNISFKLEKMSQAKYQVTLILFLPEYQYANFPFYCIGLAFRNLVFYFARRFIGNAFLFLLTSLSFSKNFFFFQSKIITFALFIIN